jgi:hypothetical protein
VTGDKAEVTVGTAAVLEVGTGTGLGAGRAGSVVVVGAGSVGAVTVGTVRVGTVRVGTVTVVTGGIGIVSARAWPASRQAPTRAVVAAAALIPQ